MKQIFFITGNKGKKASFQSKFEGSDVIVETADFKFEEPNINDIEYIAREKVLYAYSKLQKPCIALDAGFYIPNYPGKPNFPGAFPKRELLDKIGLDGLIDNMKDVGDRYCYFKEVAAYFDGIEVKYFYGLSEGYLSEEIKNVDIDKKWSDLWYVFIPQNETKTLSEMTDLERKNRKDNHTSAIDEFVSWYKEIKVLKK